MALQLSAIQDSFGRLKQDVSDVDDDTFVEWCEYVSNFIYGNLKNVDSERFITETVYYAVTSPDTFTLPTNLMDLRQTGCGFFELTSADIAYDAQSANFTVGATLTGGTSGATAVITADDDDGTTGTLTVEQVSGVFQDNETITDGSGGSATENGAPVYAIADNKLGETGFGSAEEGFYFNRSNLIFTNAEEKSFVFRYIPKPVALSSINEYFTLDGTVGGVVLIEDRHKEYLIRALDVMYCDWEASQKNQLRRLRCLERGMGLTEPAHIHYRRLRRPIWEAAVSLRAEISRLRIGLVIIDSIGYACVPEDINDAATALRAMAAARSLGITVLVVAHVAKGSGDTKTRRTPFGSVFFENSARSQWEIRKGENTEYGVVNIGLFHSKVNDGPQEQPIGLRFEFFGSTFEDRSIHIRDNDIKDDAELSQHAPLPVRLRNMLRHGSLSTSEMAKEAGTSSAYVRNTLRTMPDVIQLIPHTTKAAGVWGLKS